MGGGEESAFDAEARGGHDALEDAFIALVGQHPDAVLGALDTSGAVTALPRSVPVPDAPVKSPEELTRDLLPADRLIVAKLWGQARRAGSALGAVRRRSDPDRYGDLHLFDLTARHGVFVFAFVPRPNDDDAEPSSHATCQAPPRYARVSKDVNSALVSVDAALPQILGWTREELMGRRVLDLIHPEDRNEGIATWMEMLEHDGPARRVRLRHRHRDGSWIWLEVTNRNRLSDPRHGDILSEMVDISEEMAAHEALRARERLLAQLTDTVSVGLFHADLRGQLLFSNRRLQEIMGRARATTLQEQLAAVTFEDRPKVDEAILLATTGAETDIELSLRANDGTLRHCTMSVRPLKDDADEVTGLTGCLEDVTNMVQSRRELEAKAARDPLTGALNREATLDRLQQLLERPSPRGAGTAVIFIDLDGFKPINDQLGHAVGDELLVAFAARLQAAVRSGDAVGRFGGDEFVVICHDIESPAAALELARTLEARVFLDWERREFGPARLKASMGVAWTNWQNAAAPALIRAADEAMYAAKRAPHREPMLAPALAPG